MKQPSFSFVMPAYKAEYLSKAINSVLNQDYNNFELIIVNDASPENLKEIVKGFQDNRIRYYENTQNIGGKDLIKNWNYCVSMAENDYIILATDDDIFEPCFLSNAKKLIEKYPNVDVIRSGVKKIDEKENVLDIEFPLKEHMSAKEFVLFYAKGGTISCISNYIFRRTSLNKNGGFISFPRAHFSDDATALALSLNGVACIPSNDFCFRVSNINLSNQTNISIVIDQIKATELYMTWYLKHIATIDDNKDLFFERACYGGFKSKYINIISTLLFKIPISNYFSIYKYTINNKHLFTKEKIKLLLFYLIEKL